MAVRLILFTNKIKIFFVSEKEERQYLEWEYLVKHAQNITVKRDNDIKNSDIGIVSETEVIAPRFEGTFIAKGLYYLKLEDFNHEREIQAVYHQLEESLPQIDNLVIDVRVNHGGSDSLYIPLLPYLLEAGAAYPADDAYGMEILYTENNVDRRLKDFDDYLNSSFVTAETQAMLQEMAHDLKINKRELSTKIQLKNAKKSFSQKQREKPYLTSFYTQK